MKINKMFPSKWITANDIGEKDVVLTIKDVKEQQVGMPGKEETKACVFFVECQKGMTLNKTNAGTIQGLYGAETDDWKGKPIALFAVESEFQGKQVMAVRVRMKIPTGAPTGIEGDLAF